MPRGRDLPDTAPTERSSTLTADFPREEAALKLFVSGIATGGEEVDRADSTLARSSEPTGLGREPFCSAIPSEVRHSIDATRKQLIRQTRRPTYLLEGGLPGRSGSRAIAADHQPESAIGRLPTEGTLAGRPDKQQAPEKREKRMRSKDLMGRDLLSEIVLLGFGDLIFVSLLPILIAALSRP